MCECEWCFLKSLGAKCALRINPANLYFIYIYMKPGQTSLMALCPYLSLWEFM
jgi:hypothetical protein